MWRRLLCLLEHYLLGTLTLRWWWWWCEWKCTSCLFEFLWLMTPRWPGEWHPIYPGIYNLILFILNFRWFIDDGLSSLIELNQKYDIFCKILFYQFWYVFDFSNSFSIRKINAFSSEINPRRKPIFFFK